MPISLLLVLVLAAAPATRPCRPGPGACAPGEICEDPFGLGTGVCRRSCDAGHAPSGCGPDEVCLTLSTTGERLARPGVCRGERCLPGREAERCGGPATCAPTPPASLCLPLSEAGPGAPCDPHRGRGCRPGLACHLERCTPACGEVPCPGGARCFDLAPLLAGDEPFAVCDPGCDPVRQTGCAPGETCAPTQTGPDARWLGRCERRGPGGARPGERCRPGRGEDLQGTCLPGLTCVSEVAPDTGRCAGLCDPKDRHRCGPAAVCGGAGTTSGYCEGDCDPFTPGGCGSGRVCRVDSLRGTAADGRTREGGRCTPIASPLGPEAPCDPGADRCGDGLRCLEGADGPVCTRPCDLRPGRTPCPAGFRCAEREHVSPQERDVFGWCELDTTPRVP